MRLFIAPYKMYSESAKALAERLGVLRVNGSKSFKRSDVIINWGNSYLNIQGTSNIINQPRSVYTAVDKIATLHRLEMNAIPIVEWTTDKDVAINWMADNVVIARQDIKGSQGNGIAILKDDAWVDAPLYTKYMKAHEYRVHVFKGQVIDIQKKKRRLDAECNEYIKNSNNGWVFCREEVRAPKQVFDVSILAVNALQLDFGAVDVLYRATENKVAVLEVNSSPGLQGSTLDNYVKAIKESVCH
jgi:glutathione synthase/RimK-type ligase-like ATP-grasp enzyme